MNCIKGTENCLELEDSIQMTSTDLYLKSILLWSDSKARELTYAYETCELLYKGTSHTSFYKQVCICAKGNYYFGAFIDCNGQHMYVPSISAVVLQNLLLCVPSVSTL